MKTLCFINQKGGAGKTTTAFHLAGAFAATGQRVLVMDLDPQGSMTQAFFGANVTKQLPLDKTVGWLFHEGAFFHRNDSLIRETSLAGVHLCAANLSMARFNDPCPERWGMSQHVVAEFLGDLSGDYDLALIDCPPNLYLCSWSAMVAADYVVIPVPPEEFGTQGLEAIHQAVKEVSVINPKLKVLGHVVTRRDSRLLIHRQIENKLRDCFGDSVFRTVITELRDFLLANSARQPVEQFASGSMAADLTRSLSREILARINGESARRRVA